jgi:uncharacterized membrane protein (UPF0127 family)
MRSLALIAIIALMNLGAQELCRLELGNGVVIDRLEIADTPAQHAKGLSNRDDIGQGMIFVWGEATEVAFWMKETRVPLSVGYFGEDMRLFQVEDMTPMSLTKHPSKGKIIAALELKQGDFKRKNITIGTKIVKLDCE